MYNVKSDIQLFDDYILLQSVMCIDACCWLFTWNEVWNNREGEIRHLVWDTILIKVVLTLSFL